MFKSLKVIYSIIDAKTRTRVPLAFLIILLLSCLEIFGISLIFPLIQSIVGKGNVTYLNYFKALVPWIKVNSDHHLVIMISSFVFGLFILTNILSIFLIRWQVTFLAKADLNLSTR